MSFALQLNDIQNWTKADGSSSNATDKGLDDSFTLDLTETQEEDLSSVSSKSPRPLIIATADRFAFRRPSILSSLPGVLSPRKNKAITEERNEPISNATWHGEKSADKKQNTKRTRQLLSLSRNNPICRESFKKECKRREAKSREMKLSGCAEDSTESSMIDEGFHDNTSDDRNASTEEHDRSFRMIRQQSQSSGICDMDGSASTVAESNPVSGRANMMLRKQASARYLKMSQARANSCDLQDLLSEYDSIVD